MALKTLELKGGIIVDNKNKLTNLVEYCQRIQPSINAINHENKILLHVNGKIIFNGNINETYNFLLNCNIHSVHKNKSIPYPVSQSKRTERHPQDIHDDEVCAEYQLQDWHAGGYNRG